FLLPVLRLTRRPHLRPPAAALARRAHHLAQRRRRMLAMQSPQGQHDAGGSQDVPVADANAAERPAPAPQRPAVPAELPASELDGLSLLGFRARSVADGFSGTKTKPRRPM